MIGVADETVGNEFKIDLLEKARDRTLEVIKIANSKIYPGMLESEAKLLVQNIQAKLGAQKSWHPPQIRFGENTILPFGKTGTEGLKLKENDIYFLDIGPIFDGYEGDVGRSFCVGNNAEMIKCCKDVEEIWREVRKHWQENSATGPELYSFAKSQAEKRNWVLSLEKANGHRIADFPHAAKSRGSIENYMGKPSPNRWVLEIQIRHPSRAFGAFYEDLLN